MDASTSPADLDFAAVFAALPAPTAVFAADPPRFTVLAASDAFLALAQRARDSVVGQSLSEVMQDADVRASLTAAVQTGATQRMHRQTREVPGSDGAAEARSWDAVNTPVAGPDGAVRYVVMHLERAARPTRREVTDSGRREAELRASEEKYRALFSEMDEAYAVVEVMADAEGNWTNFLFLEVNPAFMRHTGMPDPVGRTASDLLGTPNPRWAALYGRVAETGESIRLQEGELALGRVFDLNIFRLGGEGSRQVAVLFTDITERCRAEEALRESERRYRLLFENIGEGFALAEMIWDEGGHPIDWRYLEVNDGWAQTGVVVSEILGRTAREVNPEIEPHWIESYGRVVQTGEPVRYENSANGFGKWFDTVAFKHSGDRFGLIIRDVTERVRIEAALRSSASHAAYRIALTDALRGAADPNEAQAVAMRVLGDHLGASRVLYGDADPGSAETFTNHREYRRDPAMPSSLGQHRWDDFGAYIESALRAGRTLVVDEVREHPGHSADEFAAYETMGIRAYLAVPLVRDGRIAAYLAVNHTTPHAWTAEEIALTEETAERTWSAVERARAEAALREREARYRTLFESMDEGYVVAELVYDAEGKLIDALYLEGNPAASRLTGVPDYSRRLLSEAMPGAELHWLEVYERVARTGVAERQERYAAPHGRWYDFHISRMEDGAPRVAIIFQDVTTRTRAEHALRESEERLRRALSIPTVGVLFYRLDGRIIDANAALERMIGYSIEELRGLDDWASLTPPEFAELSRRSGSELADRGRTTPYEKPWIRKDGSVMWGLFSPMRLSGSGRESECVEFIIDITRAKAAEVALRESKQRLARELDGARTLQQVSTELISEAEPGALDTKLIDAALALMSADAGSLQMLDSDGRLRLLTSRNLDPRSERHWQWVSVDSCSSCGVALRRQERVSVPDVEACDFMAGTSDLEAYRWSQVRAVHSTPLVARDGRAVGMLSTHWHRPHDPSADERALFDVLARQAADLLDRMQTQIAASERADWLKDQGDALMAAVNGAPLRSSLGALVRSAPETLGVGVRAAFYLAGSDGTALHHLVGMSDEYARAVDGFGPQSLACDFAAHSGEPVLTADVQTDPRWEPWRWMAEQFGYRACWSFPIHSTAGKLVGTLVLYWPQPRAATAREFELASLLTSTAAIIISRQREAEVRQQVESALRAALAEREALLRELHHRVKNNLQVITSLLEMQARKVHDSPARLLLTEARNRISAIGTIHELLYQSEALSSVDLLRYAERLLPHIISLYERSATIQVSVLGDAVMVDLARAVPIGLLLNELVSNVCKHAFPANAAGELTVTWKQNDERVHLRVTDSGIGLPAGFSAQNSATLGLQLVHMLAKQLGGTVAVHSTGGTTVDVHLPK